MNWDGMKRTQTAICTHRPKSGVLQAFVRQLRQLNCDIEVLGPPLNRSLKLAAAPDVAFADLDFQDTHRDSLGPDEVKAVWEQVPIIALVNEEQLGMLHFTPATQDFLPLPISMPNLDVRLRFALWRTYGTRTSNEQLEYHIIRMNLATYEVWVQNRRISLTFREFELLRYFMTHQRRVFSRADLLETVWDTDFFEGTRTVDVHIRRLRAKLGLQAGNYIHTVRNVGYRFG